MNNSIHIIDNFPENYPRWRRVVANAMFFFGRIIIHNRKNHLNAEDLRGASAALRKGDVVLVGGLRRLSSLLITGAVTHCLLYAGEKQFIHACADGVGTICLDEVFCEYDTMLILRIDHGSKKDIDEVIAFAKKQIGKPYDYEMEDDAHKFYCSELIYFAFDNAGLNIEIFDRKDIKRIHPLHYLGGRFKVIFKSHNLKITNKSVEVIKEVGKRRIEILYYFFKYPVLIIRRLLTLG